MSVLYTFHECRTEIRLGPMVLPVPPMHDRCPGVQRAQGIGPVMGGARCICPCHTQPKENPS